MDARRVAAARDGMTVADVLNRLLDRSGYLRHCQLRARREGPRPLLNLLKVFQNRRWDGDFLTVRDVLTSGELGDLFVFESAFEWWKPEVMDRRKDRTTVADGGGILYDLAPHLIDQALILFGPVRTVHAEVDARRLNSVNDDDVLVSLEHESGVRSRLWLRIDRVR